MKYRYFVAFTATTARGHIEIGNAVIFLSYKIDGADEVDKVESMLSKRSARDVVLTNFILMGTEG